MKLLLNRTISKCIRCCLILLIAFNSAGQNERHEQMIRYGQVWGFLKYFHPHPSTVDWDARLLNDFSILDQGSSVEVEKCIEALIAACPVNKGITRDTAAMDIMKGTFDWMDETPFSAPQREQLSALLLHKPVFDNAYVSQFPNGTANFMDEKKYPVDDWDPGHRYLALTRYWNMINYYFPYRPIIPKNWTLVYRELLPEFLKVADMRAYYQAVLLLSNELEDGHGFVGADKNYLDHFRFPPLFCNHYSDGTFISLVIRDSLSNYDVQKGDEIIEIDGVPIDECWRKVNAYYASSNDNYAAQASHMLRRTVSDSFCIVVRRNEKRIETCVPTYTYQDFPKRQQIPDEQPPYEFRTDLISGKTYVYVNMGILKRKDVNSAFKRKLYAHEQVIIDVRNYPNWTVMEMCKILLKGKRHFALLSEVHGDFPGSITYRPSQKVGGRKEYPGKVYILVDHKTMSQAEYTVMALQQHPRAITIGGQTAGADGNIVDLPLPFNVRGTMSGLGVFYPDMRPTQQVGIHRDIEVQQDHTYLLDPSKDAILLKALEIMRQHE